MCTGHPVAVNKCIKYQNMTPYQLRDTTPYQLFTALCLAGGEKKLDDSSRLDVVEIARVA